MPRARKRKHESELSVKSKRLKHEKEQINYQKGINDMPNEMLMNIFSYLDQTDLLKATLVQKKWNVLISNTEMTMKKINTIYINIDNLIRGVPNFTRRYNSIEVKNIKLECDLDLFKKLRKVSNGIRSIRFYHCCFLGNAMESFLKCFKNVENLHYTHCQLIGVAVHRICSLKKLKMLHLDISTWPLMLIEAPNLITLQCHSIYGNDQNLLIHFLNSLQYLEVLDLNNIDNCLQSRYVHLAPRFKLKSLKLIDLENYDKNQMMNLISQMTESMTSLEIGIEMGHEITEFVMKNYVNLKDLSIDCESLPNKPNFYNNIKTSKTLKTVEINGDLDKTMSILQFLDNHSEIENLDLSALFNIPTTRYSFWSRLSAVTKNVVSLKLDLLDADNIRYVNYKNLKDLKIYSLDSVNSSDWIEFSKNNPNIENFQITDVENNNMVEIKTVLKQNLPKLKDFSVQILSFV